MTAGGPGTASKTIPLHMVDTAFSFNEFGLSSSLGFLLTAAVIVCILIANRLLKGEQHEY
jgi:raffinose/stachyose/melibiose transport system permease protein